MSTYGGERYQKLKIICNKFGIIYRESGGNGGYN